MNPPRTWQQMAAEALAVQDACNLSGVVHSFARIVTEVRARLESEGNGASDTASVNRHPICCLYSDKIAHLTGTQSYGHEAVSLAYSWAFEQTKAA